VLALLPVHTFRDAATVSLSVIASADPYPGTRKYYDKLYSVVKGTYPLMPDE
jgi:hypothetical protein